MPSITESHWSSRLCGSDHEIAAVILSLGRLFAIEPIKNLGLVAMSLHRHVAAHPHNHIGIRRMTSRPRVAVLRRWLALIMAVSALGTGLLALDGVAFGVADTAAKRPPLSAQIAPGVLVGGEHVTATGDVGSVRRPIELQRHVRGSWRRVANVRSSSDGTFALSDPRSRAGHYRVVAPQFFGRSTVYARQLSATKHVLFAAGLSAGQTLMPNQYIDAPGHAYRLVMQGDGNLVEYQGGSALWSTKTQGNPGAHAVMQTDGNLVVYRTDGVAIYGSATDTFGGSNLALQDDGNLVIYQSGRAIWDRFSGRLFNSVLPGQSLGVNQWIMSTDHRYRLIMQGDGNLVEYQGSSALWATNSAGNPGAYAVMQTDSNLVVYKPGGVPIWASNTAGAPGGHLVLQNDSNLVIYRGAGAIWDRHSGGSGGGGGTSTGVIGDDYPAYLKSPAMDSMFDPWGFYNRECTSFVAWRLNNTNHAAFSNRMSGGHFGDAGNWDNNARTLGFTVSSTPAVGAIAQTETHVAWVAAVGNGTVTIEEYNHHLDGTYSTRTVPTSTFVYIHVKDLG